MCVLAQRFLALTAVLVTLVQFTQQRSTLAAILGKCSGLLTLLLARLFQLPAAGNDLLLGAVERLQVGRQRGDGLGALALHVAVIGQLAIGISNPVLRQQQFQRRMIAQLIGAPQQPSQLLALAGQPAFQFNLALLQFHQRLLLATHRRFGFGHRATAACDPLVGVTQLLLGIPPLRFQLPALLGDALQLAAQLLQLFLGITWIVLRQQRARHQRQHQQAARAPTRQGLEPVMAVVVASLAQWLSSDLRQVRIVTKRGAIGACPPECPPKEIPMKRFLLLLTLAVAAPQAMADDDISKVNGSIQTTAGASYRDLETVNGSVQLASGVNARSVSTVNGSIRTDENVTARNIETVNGGIRAGRNLVLSSGLETVNGSIFVDRGSRISGDVTTVNGGIGLVATQLDGDIETVNGDITVGVDSVVRGGIKVERPSFGISFKAPRKPRIIIGPNAVVEGALQFERDVVLYVHDSARIGPVTGATVQHFSSETAPAN